MAPEMYYWDECKHLLFDLKTTVEGLLANQTTNVWNTYGGLSRLTNVVDSILSHRVKSYQGSFDYWNFIMGLRVLVPSIAPWLERFRLQTEGRVDRSCSWIRQRLLEHTLSIHLNILVGDTRHLKSCYQDEAFLRQEVFCKSLLICLQAVENNLLSTLAELDPSLLVERTSLDAYPLQQRAPRHRRSPSLPANIYELASGTSLRSQTDARLTSCQLVNSSSEQREPPRQHRRSMLTGCPPGGLPEELALAVPRSTTWHSGLSVDHSVAAVSSKPHQMAAAGDVQPSMTRRRSSDPCQSSTVSTRELERQISRSFDDISDCQKSPRPNRTLSFTMSDSYRTSHDRSWGSDVIVAAPEGAGCSKEGAGSVQDQGVGALDQTSWLLDRAGVVVKREEELFHLPLVNYRREGSLESSMSGVEDACSPLPLCSKEVSFLPPPSLPSAAKLHRSPTHVRSKSDVVFGAASSAAPAVLRPVDVVTVVQASIPMSSSLPSNLNDQADVYLATHDEYGSHPFRPPVPGQSLTSFLLQQDFRTCADLERENAHFNISEALIAAIEQMKCKQMLRIAEEADRESDDDEIMHLKQRIRIRRRERLHERVTIHSGGSPRLLSDGRTDTTSQSPSPRSSSSENKSGSTSDSVDPIDLSDGSDADEKLSTLDESSGLSLSMASLYSEADIMRPVAVLATSTPLVQPPEPLDRSSSATDNLASSYVSADTVALCLLKRFSEKQLPKASDLDWLVSEQEAPQKLLPLPQSWPISPDDAENVQRQIHTQTRLRGNLEWAPPRPQVIFNIHPAPQRKVVMAKQNYRCAGCGTKVEEGYMRRFRYCEYLGKYFCQCCHNNSQAHIPARILRKWDFSRGYVSNFSRDVLDRMSNEPLFDVADVNLALYRRVKLLDQARQYRLQLFSIKDFVRVCREGKSLADELDREPSHLIASPHLYSVNDLLRVRSGEMVSHLKTLVNQALQHIKECLLCQARGFYCEFCKNNKEIIFPFQLGKVSQCSECWSCFHSDCYVPEKCPKCARIEARKIRQQLSDDTD